MKMNGVKDTIIIIITIVIKSKCERKKRAKSKIRRGNTQVQ